MKKTIPIYVCVFWALFVSFCAAGVVCYAHVVFAAPTVTCTDHGLNVFENIYGPDYFPLTDRTMYYVRANGYHYTKEVYESVDRDEFLPQKSGCRYYKKHVFFFRSGQFWYDNTWHMRNCLDGEVAEIADTLVDKKWTWTNVHKEDKATCYYYEKPITHIPAGDHVQPFRTYCDWPIKMWYSNGPDQNPYTVSHTAWMANLMYEHFDEYRLEHGSRKIYKDVIKKLYIHGTYASEGNQAYCPDRPIWCPHYAPYNSYWVLEWYAKDVGLIKAEVIYHEDHCNGSLTDPNPENWKAYLHHVEYD